MPCIAFIHNHFPAGGAERITQDIAEYLHKTDGEYRIFVYASAVDAGAVSGHITARQIPRKGKARSKSIEDLIIRDKIDILVQVTAPVDDIEGIRRRTGCKAVLANHGEPFWQRHAIAYRRQNSPLKRLLWRLFNEKRYIAGGLALKMAIDRSRKQYDGCDAYTVLCQAYRKQTAEAFGIEPESSHIYAIENSEKPVENISWQKEKMILFCGRLDQWSKRTDRLLRIWKRVQDMLPDWQLAIVGDGPERGNLERQMKEEDLERVTFYGQRNDVESFYRRASVVALTSQTEGWPLVMTEAQAHGCIPIAFGCTEGVHEILGPDGINGFIITPFDEEEYARTLVRIAGMSPEQTMAIRMSAAAKRRQFTPEKTASKWKTLFDNL